MPTSEQLQEIIKMLAEQNMTMKNHGETLTEIKMSMANHVKDDQERLTSLEHWRERTKGASWAIGIFGGVLGAWLESKFFTK